MPFDQILADEIDIKAPSLRRDFAVMAAWSIALGLFLTGLHYLVLALS